MASAAYLRGLEWLANRSPSPRCFVSGLARPSPPLRRAKAGGGHGRNRTGVQGFAVLCVTTPPRGPGLPVGQTAGAQSLYRRKVAATTYPPGLPFARPCRTKAAHFPSSLEDRDDRLCRRAPHDGGRPGPHRRRHRPARHFRHAGSPARALRAAGLRRARLSRYRLAARRRAPPAQADGARQTHAGRRNRPGRSRARRRLRHRLWRRGAGAGRRQRGGAGRGQETRGGGERRACRHRQRDAGDRRAGGRLAAGRAL